MGLESFLLRSDHWDKMIRMSEEKIEINVLGNTKKVAPKTNVPGG